MTTEFSLGTALTGAFIGCLSALVVRWIFDRYSHRAEKQRYAAALRHEIRRIAKKLEEYATQFENMVGQYDPEIAGFPFAQPAVNPIREDDLLVHRSMVRMIGSLKTDIALMILDFYNDVRDLDITEQTLMDVLPSIEKAYPVVPGSSGMRLVVAT